MLAIFNVSDRVCALIHLYRGVRVYDTGVCFVTAVTKIKKEAMLGTSVKNENY
jgi:hypothetical protein